MYLVFTGSKIPWSTADSGVSGVSSRSDLPVTPVLMAFVGLGPKGEVAECGDM
jgi:hypothetical protein